MEVSGTFKTKKGSPDPQWEDEEVLFKCVYTRVLDDPSKEKLVWGKSITSKLLVILSGPQEKQSSKGSPGSVENSLLCICE